MKKKENDEVLIETSQSSEETSPNPSKSMVDIVVRIKQDDTFGKEFKDYFNPHFLLSLLNYSWHAFFYSKSKSFEFRFDIVTGVFTKNSPIYANT